ALNFAERRIEDILPEDIIQVEDPLPSTIVASILSEIIDSIPSTTSTPENSGRVAEEAVASGHIEVPMEDIRVELEHPAAQGDSVMADAPIQGEQVSNEADAPIEGELSKEGSVEATPVVDDQEERHRDSPILNDREGETASPSSSDDDQPPPAKEGKKKGKEVASEVHLLADTPFQRQVKQKIVINLKPVIERLDAQGTILCSLQSDVSSIFMIQASTSKDISNIRNAMKWFNQEMGSMKSLLGEILKVVGAQVSPPPPPAAQVPQSGPSAQEVGPTGPEAAAALAEAAVIIEGPSGPDDQVKGPPGPAEQGSGPSGPLESESMQKEAEESLAPKPLAPPSPSHTPIPPTPPSAPTAPPTPQTFKKPQSRPISSPTPFPPQSTSSPTSSTTIPSPSPILEAPPASSAGAFSSSSGPSLGPVDDFPTTSHSFLHPTPPPSFITIILERAQLNSPFMEKINDEFEEGILRFPPRDHSLTLSEWFRMYHQELWAPFIQKEIKMDRHYVLFNNYRYVHRLLDVQLSQFKRAISALTPDISHTSDVQVDFATLQVPEEIDLPQIHFLVMESSVGSIIFERFARVMGRIKVQKGCLVAFPRFLFREYHQGHVSAEVLAPILSECERLTSSAWSKFYPLSAQQLFEINEAQARDGKPAISPATFLDMNSIHLVDDPFKVWEERYKVYMAMHKALRDNH
ncbi:hypothetical protein Taro_051075, partial [Colocasia esculenta]|nr:hypothetical protein [Colocasia esculenta]